MSKFTGPQGRGAMRRHREKKRREAEVRNVLAFIVRWPECGHISSSADHPCEIRGAS